ncbi:MAG: hypothetical protein ACXWZ6_12465 [Solirubrobacterales bacterium]
MLSRSIKALRRRVGPVGLSLIAAALTAAAFAAVSTAAKDDSGNKQGDQRGAVERSRHAPPELSEEDQAKLEEFRQCLEDNGVSAPPEPGELEEGDRPEPPSKAELKKMQKAHEACADKLPEGMEFHGGPGGPMGCGPGGPPPEAGSNREGTALPAPPSGGSQGDVMVAPQGSTS